MAGRVLTREKVYDPILRIIHAWNALAIILLLLGAQIAKWLAWTPEAVFLWRFHVWIGYALLVGLVARLLWGLNGPSHARLGALWQWRAWRDAAHARQLFGKPEGWGHHAVASAVYLLLYLLLAVMVVSGLMLTAVTQGAGPLAPWFGHAVDLKYWLRMPHDYLEEVVLGFVLIHLAALVLHEMRHGIPVAQAMVSGYQYRELEHEEQEKIDERQTWP